jgi:putative Mg2+ transporter-C (MgtC) family protein
VPTIGLSDIVLRLGVATLFGMAVGIERERRERAAGVRTMALVGLGSALFTLISAYAYSDLIEARHLSLDPTRIMAQIVSGIGFLGAGVIWLRKDVVRGLTTAAALWVVAAVGMASGSGLWAPAIVTVVTLLVVLVIVRPIERYIFPPRTAQVLRVWMDLAPADGAAISQVYDACAHAGLVVDSVSMRPSKGEAEVIEVRCRAARAAEMTHALESLRQLPGVQAVRADVRGLRGSA